MREAVVSIISPRAAGEPNLRKASLGRPGGAPGTGIEKAEESLAQVRRLIEETRQRRARTEMQTVAEMAVATPAQRELQGEVSEAKPNIEGMNISVQVILRGGRKALFKPKSGEVFLRREVPVGTYYKRAVAAYLVSRALDINLVPTTTVRVLGGEIGSLTRWIDAAARHPEPHESMDFDTWPMAVFDYLIGNQDRHRGNILLLPSGQPVAIDNDLSFPLKTTYAASLAIKEHLGQEVPPELMKKLLEADVTKLDYQLSSLIEADAKGEFWKRWQRLLETGRLEIIHRGALVES